MALCNVATCKNTSKKTGKSVAYHRFPKDKQLRRIWIARCKRAQQFNPDSTRICSIHFTPEDYERDLRNDLLGIPARQILKPGAIPSLNLKRECKENESLMKCVENQKHKIERKERYGKRSSKKVVEDLLNQSVEGLPSTSISTCFEKNVNEIENSIINDHDKNLEKEIQIKSGIPYCHHLHNFEHEKQTLLYEIECLKAKCLKSDEKLKMARETNVEIKNEITKLNNMQKEIKEGSFDFDQICNLMYPSLTKTQVNQLINKNKKIAWSNEDFCHAFTLRYLGKRPYMYLRDKLKLPLPAISTLQRWASKLKVRRGILSQVIQMIKIAATKMEEKDKYIVIEFDEMKVKSCYEYDTTCDKVLGKYSQMQVVMVRSLFSNWKQPIYFEFNQKMTKDILFKIVEEVHQASFKVVAMVSDCGGGNMGLWEELGINIENTSFKNPVTNDYIYVFANAPHLLKLIRNWTLDTGIVLQDGSIINKHPLEALLKLDATEVKACHNLSNIHLSCERSQRQNVQLAAQLLSYKTAQALKYYKPGNNDKLAEDTGNFIELIDKWFDLFNTFSINKFAVPWKSTYGMQLHLQNEILDKVNELFSTMRCTNKKSLQTFQKGIIITNTSLKNLLIDMRSKISEVQYILTHKLNQDALENLFSQLRTRGELNDHPTPLDAISRMRMIILGKVPGIVQSKTNDQSDEDFIVAKVLRETEVVRAQVNARPLESSEMSESSIEQSSSSNEIRKRSHKEEVSEGCEEDGLRYLAGYIAKKFSNKYPELCNFTSPKPQNIPHNMPSSIKQIFCGSLVDPSDTFFNLVKKIEIEFIKFHRNHIYTQNKVVKKLSAEVFKIYSELPLEVITAYIRQRTFIRIKYLNELENSKTKNNLTSVC